MDHTHYDTRRYPIVGVREGYGEWVRTYEATVQDEMDLQLLDRLRPVDWAARRRVLDLACGTGRIGVWLRQHGTAAIDGVDLTPEMLELARAKGVYRALHVADVCRTMLPGGAYELAIQSLADEHLPDLAPLYREVARLTTPDGTFVLVGYPPPFLLSGITTPFARPAIPSPSAATSTCSATM